MVSAYYTTLISIFAIIGCLLIIDPNFGLYFELQVKNLWVQIRRRWFIMTMYPRLKYDTWQMKRNLHRIRMELNLPNDEES